MPFPWRTTAWMPPLRAKPELKEAEREAAALAPQAKDEEALGIGAQPDPEMSGCQSLAMRGLAREQVPLGYLQPELATVWQAVDPVWEGTLERV